VNKTEECPMPEPASSSPAPSQKRPAARSKFLQIRVSEEEHAAIVAKAEEAGMPASKLIRDHLGQLWVRNRSDEQRRNEVLNRINANLNMLARWCNTYKGQAESLPLLTRLLVIEGLITRLVKRMDRSS
jgi:hypothetical protein